MKDGNRYVGDPFHSLLRYINDSRYTIKIRVYNEHVDRYLPEPEDCLPNSKLQMKGLKKQCHVPTKKNTILNILLLIYTVNLLEIKSFLPQT